jgi:hypothetical protein
LKKFSGDMAAVSCCASSASIPWRHVIIVPKTRPPKASGIQPPREVGCRPRSLLGWKGRTVNHATASARSIACPSRSNGFLITAAATSPATPAASPARVRAGLARARAEGKRLGRPPIAPALEKLIRNALAAPGRPGVRVIARQFGVNVSTVQRIAHADT